MRILFIDRLGIILEVSLLIQLNLLRIVSVEMVNRL